MVETGTKEGLEAQTSRRAIGATLAVWSWFCFAMFLVTNLVGRATGLRVLAELVGLGVLLLGGVLGATALLRISRDGKQGILWPALIAVILNWAFVAIWISNFLSILTSARRTGG